MPFTIYKSSAGSGKTFTLVKEYLKLAISREDKFRRILAVTFTNKAAEEMKSRILEALAGIATGKTDKKVAVLLEQIVSETGIPKTRITAEANRVLMNILHNYSEFSVSTIDSFVHSVIRTFAKDLKLSWNFEVSTDEERILSQTVDELLEWIGLDEELTRAVIAYAEDLTDEERSWNIEKPIKNLAKIVLKDQSAVPLQRLEHLSLSDFNIIKKQLTDYIRTFENKIRAEADKALRLIAQKGIDEASLYQGKKGIAGYFRKLIGNFEVDALIPKTYVEETIEQNKWFAKSLDKTVQRKILEIKDDLETCYQNLQISIRKNISDYVLSSAILQKVSAVSLLTRINTLLQERNREANLVLISEFNKRVHEVVAHESIPYLFERIGEKFEHYLVDEFQDTSLLQWSNLLPLVENSLASGHRSMVVGDGKQAIYRFRNGDVEQFDNLPEIIGSKDDPILAEREASLKNDYTIEHLETNFRSAEHIVAFNNDLYKYLSRLPELEGFQTIYEKSEQFHDPDHKGGYVSIEFLEPKNVTDPDQLWLEKTLDLIRTLHSNDCPYKDIGILMRRNEEASLAAEYLIKHGIPVISAESVLIYRSPEVAFILAVMRFLTDPDDAIVRAEILLYLFRKHPPAESDFHSVFSWAAKTNDFYTAIEKLGYHIHFKNISHLSLYELAENVIASFDLSSKPDLFINHFLDAALAYSAQEGNSPDEFLSWWEEKKSKFSVTFPQGIDAVQIMTIHKAKGLEFPVVILPQANWGNDKIKDLAWILPELEFAPMLETALISYQKNLLHTRCAGFYSLETEKTFLDNLNLLYVATTRAKERLYMFCDKVDKPSGSAKNINELIMRYLNSLTPMETGKNKYEFGDSKIYKPTQKEHPQSVYDLSIQKKLKSNNKIVFRAASKKLYAAEENAEINWGRILHAALARVYSIRDIAEAADYLFSVGEINNEERDRIHHDLTDLLNRDEIRPFFETGLRVKTEAEMADSKGNLLRADRLIIRNDTVIVIDYKTGRAHARSHIEQLSRYAECIAGMGYARVEKYLIYTEEKKLEKI